MYDGWIHPLAQTYILLPTTRDKMLLHTIEIWTKNHLVSDCNCTNVNLQSSPPPENYKEWQIVLGYYLVLKKQSLIYDHALITHANDKHESFTCMWDWGADHTGQF